MEQSRGDPGHLPRPYGGDYPRQGFAEYEPVDARPDPLRTLDVERIGRYPLLAAWAVLHDVRLAGRAGVEILDQAIIDKALQLNGPIMNEVAYYVGDLLCDEHRGWRWNVDAWGLPVLALDTSREPGRLVWDVLEYVRRSVSGESPSLIVALDRFGADPGDL